MTPADPDNPDVVCIYGLVDNLTADPVRLYQGSDGLQYYEIPQVGIVGAEKIRGDDDVLLTKLSVTSTMRITFVGSGKARLPAAYLAEVVEAIIKKPLNGCRPGCLVGGRCVCAPTDYWLKLDADTARKLGVEVL